MAKLSALQHLGLAFESAYGTATTPTVWIPTTSVKPEDEIKKIQDEGRRANLSKVFNVYDGVTSSKVDVDFECYPDAIGYLLKAILGQPTTTGTGNYTHTFKIVNALAPSLTLSYFNGIAEHAHAGSVINDLQFKFDTEGVVNASAKFIGMKSSVVATTTPSYSTIAPFMGWGTTLSIGGTSNSNVVGGEVTLKREAKLLYGANNSQAPNKYSSGRIELTGKLTFDVESENELNLLGGADTSLALTFNKDANTQMIVSCNTVDISKAIVDTSQEFVRVDLEFTALYNTTDAGIVTVTLKNAVASY